jgi:23S rRNA U2552 (ribose-2'-O)-methylase RlmE/FtsJ
VQIEPIITELEARVLSQTSLMGNGPDVEQSVTVLLELLRPAVRQAALSIAEQAAEEIRPQLSGHRVDLTIVDGDPVLRLQETREESRVANEEDFAARITLRLPPSLKNAIETYAGDTGESVNTWVVKTLEGKATRRPRGGRVNTTFEI